MAPVALPKLEAQSQLQLDSSIATWIKQVGAFLIPAAPALPQMSAMCTRFFDLPLSTKLESEATKGTLGFRRIGVENLAVQAGDDESAPPDHNESFAADVVSMATNRNMKFAWPDLPGFHAAWRTFHHECANIGNRLLPLILGDRLPALGGFPPSADAHLARAVRYPPFQSETRLGAGAHTDFGWLTLISATQDGLEIKVGDDWSAVHIPNGQMLVILGDMAALATGQELCAAPHRVTTPTAVRDAVLFFYNPDRATVIHPPRVTFETWLTSKVIRRQLRGWSSRSTG